MGRPKHYATAADRQAAYRQRLHTETVVVDRPALARLEARLARLHAAIAQAARRGDPCARQVLHGSQETTLEALCAWFEAHAAPALDADG